MKIIELFVLKIGRDGLIDRPHDGIIPKRKLFRFCAEANYITGAGRFGVRVVEAWDRVENIRRVAQTFETP